MSYTDHVDMATIHPYSATLIQCADGIVWDGDLISTTHAKQAQQRGHIWRHEGFNGLSNAGLDYLLKHEFVKR